MGKYLSLSREGEGVSRAHTWTTSILGRGNSKCKGAEAGRLSSRKSRDTGCRGQSWGRVVGDEDRELMGWGAGGWVVKVKRSSSRTDRN